MRRITVDYHREGSSWWAESVDLPGFSAAADTRAELEDLVREGVDFALDGEPFVLVEATGWKTGEFTVSATGVSTFPEQRTTGSAALSPALLGNAFGFAARTKPWRPATNPAVVML
jgi:predicted RNase H-like HicB family nuclease